jgi:hypothetical protein
MIPPIAGFIIGASVVFFSYPAGIDEGYQRSYNHCVEQQAQKQMLSDARFYCGAITGRTELRRKQRLE